MALARPMNPVRLAQLAACAGSVLLVCGCGGGGSGDGGVTPPSKGLLVGGLAIVKKLDTPQGLVGSRGAGANVFVAFNIQDKEFNSSSVEVEYGYDANGDGFITDGSGNPPSPNEFHKCTEYVTFPPVSDGLLGLDTAAGKGADHLFVWDTTTDLPGARFMSQAYLYNAQGRLVDGNGDPIPSGTDPVFQNFPALKMRMRVNDSTDLSVKRWSPWKVTASFDLNNNRASTVTIDTVAGVLNGVTPNATGNTVDSNVVLNFKIIDQDSTLPTGNDLVAVNVDYAAVAPGANLSDPLVVAALVWKPATKAAGTTDVDFVGAPSPGTPGTFTWDSLRDVGTVNGDYVLRITPFNSHLSSGTGTLQTKNELGVPVMMAGVVRVDNYTVFTNDARLGLTVDDALSSARVGHRAAILASGNVLIAGGRTSPAGASVATAERYIPGPGLTTTGVVVATGSMNAARSFHSMTRLYDDRVLVAGGFDAAGNPRNSLELYDESTGVWTTLAATMTQARARHTAVLLNSGDVLLAGGVSNAAGTPLASAEIYHADTKTVTAVATGMGTARHSVRGSILPDGKAMIPGGTGAAGALASTEIYDPDANSFAAGPAMSAARTGHTVSTLTSGKVAVAGGTGVSTVAIYDHQTGTWDESLPAMPSDRGGHVGVPLGDGRLLVAGGVSGGAVQSTAFTYRIATGAADPANGPMVTGRQGAEAVNLLNGRVLVIGGLDASGAALASTEIFTQDGGGNVLPVSEIFTPLEPQSWGLGGVFRHRLVDPEGNPSRVVFQYSYQLPDTSLTPWKDCTPAGLPWQDAVADDFIGDRSHGIVGLATATATSTLPINEAIPNTPGDHLFVWSISSDITTRANYDVVRIRAVPFGASRGPTTTSYDFSIASNTRVFPRFADYTLGGPYSGTVTLNYHLQDIDAPDPARVKVEYALDANDDHQITGSETWKTCTAALGSDPIGSAGSSYPLATSLTYSPTVTPGSNGWHVFNWDSVRDIGAPPPGQTWTNVMLRITAYDFPSGAAETTGLQATMGTLQGFDLVLPPTGLYLLDWSTEGGAAYAGSAIGNVKLDETLVFHFNRQVDPATVDGAVGLSTLKIQSVAGGRTLLGAYQVDPLDATRVRFFPQVVGRLANGNPDYAGTEDPSVLVKNLPVKIFIPAYTPGTNPETATVLRINGWVAGQGAADIANLVASSYNPAFTTSNQASLTANYFSRAGNAPTVTATTPAAGATGQATDQGFSITFDNQVLGASASFGNVRFVVDLDGNGTADANDPVIPGTWSLANTAGAAGARQSILTFTPAAGSVFPTTSSILAFFGAGNYYGTAYSGLTAGDGTASVGLGGGSPTTSFTTGGSGTVTTQNFLETFDSAGGANPYPNRDAANTTALWDNPAFTSRITGMRDGGSGVDGNPTSGANSSLSGGVRTFSSKAVYNFTSFNVPVGERWVFTGTASNIPVEVYCTGSIDIAGIVDLSGGDAPQTRYTADSTTSTVAHDLYGPTSNGTPIIGSTAFVGGVGIGGGAKGSNSVIMYYPSYSGVYPGIPYGGVQANSGGGAPSYYYYGGGGGGHAQTGQPGGYYTGGGTLGGAKGTAFGNADFSANTGLLLNKATGGGGGGGGSSYPSYTSANQVSPSGTYYFVCSGGAGGAGGGGIHFACNTTFTVRGSGVIDVSGGSGGNGYYYSYNGGGGGGAGGGVWIQAGGKVTLGGIIDISGGLGGDMTYNGSLSYQNPNSGGRLSACGGHGSAGRLQIEGPNNVTMTTTPVFLAGAAYGTTAPTANAGADGLLYGGTGALGAFPGSVSNAALNLDSSRDANGYLNYSSMTIPAGVTIALTSSSNKPARIRVSGNVSISGTLKAVGLDGNLSPNTSSYVQFPSIPGAPANNGGFAGGDCLRSSQSSYLNGYSGSGTGGGAGGSLSGLYSSTTYYMCAGGGGGSNLPNYYYRHNNNSSVPFFSPVSGGSATFGAVVGSLGAKKGRGSMYIEGYYRSNVQGGAAGVGGTNPELLTMANIVGGSGGGGAAPVGPASGSVYANGTGGAGGGAIAIETAGTFTMAATGVINVQGGRGGMGSTSYYGGGGGGGSGGTVLVRASALALSNGATIDAMGGNQGMCYYSYTYGYYNNLYGGDGGRGGLGALRMEAVNSDPAAIYMNTAAFIGYSATTGSLTRKTRVGGGDTALTLWQTAAGMAPDFWADNSNAALRIYPSAVQGVSSLTLEGAMMDPATGLRSTTLLGSQVISTTAPTQGLAAPDPIDGFKFWRLRWTLTASNPAAEVYDTRIQVDTK